MTKDEFKTRVLPVKDKIFRLAFALLKSRSRAKDAVQDVYLKLWNMRRKLPKYNSVEALAITITKNTCLDTLRSYRNRNQNKCGIEKMTILDDRNNPVQEIEQKERFKQVHDNIKGLPDQQRLILHLREIEQYTYDEIEEITDMSRNNIRVTLSRGRKKVKEEYQKNQHYEGGKD